MKKRCVVVCLVLLVLSFLPADGMVLRLKARVDNLQASYGKDLLFTVDNDQRISDVAVVGAEWLYDSLYRATSSAVVVDLLVK